MLSDFHLESEQKQFALLRKGTIFGRSPKASIQLNFPSIDEKQCLVRKNNMGVLTILNLAPNRKTFVNGRALQPAEEMILKVSLLINSTTG